MPSIICQRCREINEPNTTTCQKCGARFCPYCHLVIESPDTAVCTHCGKKDPSFKPGKYLADAHTAPAVLPVEYSASRYACPSCGNRIDPTQRKCPYCGQLGNRFTMTPTQGYGMMKPAHSEATYASVPAAAQEFSTQKVCAKCGTPIPPGSSMCPIHGKFGGGSTLQQNFIRKDKTIEAEAYRRMAERGTGAASEQTIAQTRRTPPENIFPQVGPGQLVPQGTASQPYTHDLRICPNCSNPVPDRSRVCPTCGCNRLPAEKTIAYIKAADRYKTMTAAAPPYPAYASQPYPAYNPQPDQYYGQPAVQPYEMAYPAPAPGFIEEIPGKGRKQGKKTRENEEKGARPGQKSSPLPILLALIALLGVIIISIVFIMDQLKTPAPAVMPPTTTQPVDSPQAPTISNIQYSDITRTSATVTWKTDKKSNSIVIYCLDGGTLCENAKDDALVTDHVVNLTNLEQGKTYHITVKSRLGDSPDSPDASREATEVIRTSEVRDTTPPVISEVKVSNISSSVTGGSAEITWKTDEPATSQVSYGTSASYGTLQPSQTDTTLALYHDVILNGLAPQTTFHYKVTSRDADGNEKSSPDATFVTPAPAGSSIGNSAPDFTLACADGSQVTLSSLRGKKVIINFWNLACGYCMAEMPHFQTVRANHPESDVAMLVINSAAGGFSANRPEAVGEAITSANWTFTVPLDEAGTVSQAYNVTSGIPVTFFLDSNGIIKSKQDGAFPSAAEIESRLNSY